MIIGNIVYENELKFDDFKQVDSINSIENSLPKLIVGKEYCKKMGFKISILNKKIDKNTFWTFSPEERKSEFNDDFQSFKKHCLNVFLNNIEYYYIDPFQLKYSSAKKIINKIKTNTDGLYYIKNKMCYIYFNNITLGINFEVLEYIGIQEKKIINHLESNKFKTLLIDKIFNECTEMVNETNNIKVLPYLYYHKKNDK
jgi:hypothetical protein